ncbi:hypothetical protein PCL_02878 [Purpureocillium lilacinum]|uniref:Uncharacterized protein n=1 Tax=Purpureocillium lilacinum TaxID=33203 RepID=A0A2U3DZ52_PURLI|nr:hypothetical protein Purlil1_6899 [Purpureocillium lilacinum]PWI67524.1 hypothetical protein PCL_02878 [Purpureocillium lilacinum]
MLPCMSQLQRQWRLRRLQVWDRASPAPSGSCMRAPGQENSACRQKSVTVHFGAKDATAIAPFPVMKHEPWRPQRRRLHPPGGVRSVRRPNLALRPVQRRTALAPMPTQVNPAVRGHDRGFDSRDGSRSCRRVTSDPGRGIHLPDAATCDEPSADAMSPANRHCNLPKVIDLIRPGSWLLPSWRIAKYSGLQPVAVAEGAPAGPRQRRRGSGSYIRTEAATDGQLSRNELGTISPSARGPEVLDNSKQSRYHDRWEADFQR